MNARAIGVGFCLALVATGVVCGQASAALVADSGFRPAKDGYSFPNYVNSRQVSNLGVDEMRRLFGDAVCAGDGGPTCLLSAPALAWMEQENLAMAGGHCFGFSVTSLLFWAKAADVGPFGAPAVARLKIAGNASLTREIAYGHAFQDLPSVVAAKVASSPRTIVATLISNLNAGGPLYTLGLVGEFGGGHAVTPYAVDRLARGKYAILVYDNNHPGQARKVMVDAKANTWNYRAAVNPKTPGSLYKGNAGSHTLFLLPARPGLGVQSCPFCAPLGLPTLTSTLRAAANVTPRRPLQSIRLQSSGPVHSHLLITDAAGRRLGFIRRKLVNEIPGARVVHVLVDGPATWRDRSEPQYEVPTGKRYHMVITADPANGRRVTSQQSVTVLEPGIVAAARKLAVAPGQRAKIDLSADGRTISFLRPSGLQQPELLLGSASPGSYSYRWILTPRSPSVGKRVSASLDITGQKLSLTGPGTYDVRLERIGNELTVFTRPRTTVGVGDTVVVSFDLTPTTTPAAQPTPSPAPTPTPAPARQRRPRPPRRRRSPRWRRRSSRRSTATGRASSAPAAAPFR